MSSVNKAILIGRLGKDPELKHIPSGNSVCSFSVATTNSWKDQNCNKHEKTEWHNIVIWGKLGENCSQYLFKGRQVYIEGRIETRSWEDKQNSQLKHYKTEIIATDVRFLGGRSDSHQNEQPQKVTKEEFDLF